MSQGEDITRADLTPQIEAIRTRLAFERQTALAKRRSDLARADIKLIGGWTVVGLVVVGSIIYWMGPGAKPDDIVKTAGVFVTLIVGIITAQIARRNARLQVESVTDVEDLKLENAELLALVQGHITIAVNQATQRFESTLLEKAEEISEFVKKRSEAYDHLGNVASELFGLLEPFRDGQCEPDELATALEKARTEERWTAIVPDRYAEHWYRLVQYAREMHALATMPNPLLPLQVWQKHGNEVRQEYNALLQEAGKRGPAAPPSQP